MQVIILGCGRVGASLAARLSIAGHDIVVVDQDASQFRRIADLDCVKISGIVFDTEILEKAGIETADAVCCVTSDENMNVMAAEVCQRIYSIEQVYVRTFLPENDSSYRRMGLKIISGTAILVDHFMEELTVGEV